MIAPYTKNLAACKDETIEQLPMALNNIEIIKDDLLLKGSFFLFKKLEKSERINKCLWHLMKSMRSYNDKEPALAF